MTAAPLVASLVWYDLAELREATDALWAGIARVLEEAGEKDVPTALDRDPDWEAPWAEGTLLFGQACGFDVLLTWRDALRPLATPRYRAPGCEDVEHASFILVREDEPVTAIEDLRGTRCVLNTPSSHSGMNVLRALVAPLHRDGHFFRDVAWSGSHERSVDDVREGRADVAAVDCVTHALLARHRPSALEGLRILLVTPRVPAPPFVTRAGASRAQVARLRGALGRALTDPALAEARDALLIDGASILPRRAYRPIARADARARAHGYVEIQPRRSGRLRPR